MKPLPVAESLETREDTQNTAIIRAYYTPGQNVLVASGVAIGNNVEVQNNVAICSGATITSGTKLGPEPS